MASREPYVLLGINWLPEHEQMKLPNVATFRLTGYREEDGPSGLFSVYLAILDGPPRPGFEQTGKLIALFEAMRERLPAVGSKFFLTAGNRVIAECITRDRGTLERPFVKQQPEPE